MSLAVLEPYVDGYIDPGFGNEITVVPRVKFPFSDYPTPDTYTRQYERDYEVNPRALPRIDQRTAWTNIVVRSEEFDNASWTKTNLSVTANNVTAPDGLVTMDKLLETTANAEHSVAQAATVTAAPYEVSFFIKGGLTREWVRGAFTDSAATVFSAFFSTSGYAVSASAGTTAGIVSLGNGHFNCWLRFTPASGAGTFKANLSTDGSTISYAGTTSAGIYLWGAQVALGSVAPYISTLGASRSILAPDRDPRDPFAYLLTESDPDAVSSHRARVMRTLGRVPLTQTIPGSIWVTKPELTGLFPQVINGSLVTQPDPTKKEYAFSTQVAVTGDSGAPATAITGGTFTVSFGANTTAGIAWNASAATVQTAINGLASVIAYGSVVVTGSHTAGFTITWAAYTTSSVDGSSLTATNATIFLPGVTSGMSQRVIIQPVWTSGNYSVTSSVTPAGANPLLTTGGTAGTLFKVYSYSAANYSATGGSFTITAFGQTTAAIAWNATLVQIKAALDLLSEFTNRGGALVSGTALDVPNGAFTVDVVNQPALTGGSFLLNVLGQNTAAIAYNASIGTIQTAINLLSNVTARGGVIVGGAGFASGKQDFTINFANIPAMTGSAASLTPSGSSLYINTTTSQGLVNTLSFSLSPSSVRLLTAVAHGILTADNIYVNSTLVLSGGFSVPDANTISLNSLSGLVSSATPITFVGKVNGVSYIAGPKETRCNFVTDYYFPGVTSGISTAADIPIPDYHGDDESLIDAIFAGSTEININTGQLAQYSDTPILARTITKINAALL